LRTPQRKHPIGKGEARAQRLRPAMAKSSESGDDRSTASMGTYMRAKASGLRRQSGFDGYRMERGRVGHLGAVESSGYAFRCKGRSNWGVRRGIYRRDVARSGVYPLMFDHLPSGRTKWSSCCVKHICFHPFRHGSYYNLALPFCVYGQRGLAQPVVRLAQLGRVRPVGGVRVGKERRTWCRGGVYVRLAPISKPGGIAQIRRRRLSGR